MLKNKGFSSSDRGNINYKVLNVGSSEQERSSKKTLSLFFITGVALLLSSITFVVFADEEATDANVDDLADIEVTGERSRNDRAYTKEGADRFITKPYGESESILKIAAKTKELGVKKRVSTRKITMPPSYVGSFINMYKHTYENGKTFYYFEGENFEALGFAAGKGSTVVDVLSGAAFTGPKLWGPYDQVIGKNRSSMTLLMADGGKDGLGLLKSSYSVGHTAVMDEEEYDLYGSSYFEAVLDTVALL
jgi:hypothetical protein